MKLALKFNLFGICFFVILCGLFYTFCPLPSRPVLRALVCVGAAAVFFGMCFVVVTRQSPLRRK